MFRILVCYFSIGIIHYMCAKIKGLLKCYILLSARFQCNVGRCIINQDFKRLSDKFSDDWHFSPRHQQNSSHPPVAFLAFHIRLLGIKQLSASIGIGSSHIQIMPPFPRFKEALSITLYFLTSRRSGEALFLISSG